MSTELFVDEGLFDPTPFNRLDRYGGKKLGPESTEEE